MNATEPMDILALPRNPVPINGTIPRCPHSIYAPDEAGTAAYSCRLCFPVCPVVQRPIVIPVDSGTALNRDGKVHANKKEPGSCPSCGSRVHFESNGKTWCCGECDHEYPAPVRKVWQPETDTVELVAA